MSLTTASTVPLLLNIDDAPAIRYGAERARHGGFRVADAAIVAKAVAYLRLSAPIVAVQPRWSAHAHHP